LANTLGYELVKAKGQKSTHSTNPDAIDLAMRGWAAHWQPPTKESITLARDYFERALTLDPQNVEAMVGLAYTRGRTRFYGCCPGLASSQRREATLETVPMAA
jgi:adenylate cyclase